MGLTKQDVPVFIDKIDKREDQRMVRFYCFVVTLTTKEPSIFSEGVTNPLVHFSGKELEQLAPAISWYESTHHFILRASLKGEIFSSPEEIQQLFDFCYERELAIGAEYFTRPVFDDLDRKMERGEVYRLPLEGLLILERGVLDVPTPDFSPIETQAFAAWNEQVIGKIKKRYKKHPEKNLRTRGLER